MYLKEHQIFFIALAIFLPCIVYWGVKWSFFPPIQYEEKNEVFFLFSSNARGMALVSLANILHRTGYSKDASIVVDASLHFLSDKKIGWFTLGNIFAVSINAYY